MSRRHGRRLVMGASAVLILSVAPAGVATASAASGSGGLPCPQRVPFSAGTFHHPTDIDNEYLPMVPGTRHVYTGTTSGGSHQIVSTVTDLTKVVDGVRARVIQEVDIQDGQVTESELTLFAQDDRGDVWNLAEYPETFDDSGTFTGAPDTWVAGLRKTLPGIHMLADPEKQEVRNEPYLQGSAPSIDFLDCARVHSVDGRATVPVGTFRDVLTTYETSPLESTGAIQTKEHAPHVGIVRVGALHDPEGETLVLTGNVSLSRAQRAAADQAALREDVHGRATNRLWARTPPARHGG
jgi:hypothetical protein